MIVRARRTSDGQMCLIDNADGSLIINKRYTGIKQPRLSIGETGFFYVRTVGNKIIQWVHRVGDRPWPSMP